MGLGPWRVWAEPSLNLLVAQQRRRAGAQGGAVPEWLGRWLRRWTQAAAERLNAGTRRNTLTNDERTERMLAFSGRGE